MSFSTAILYDTASHFSFDTALVEVSGGVIRLKDLGGATYSTANPAVETQNAIMASSLTSLAESKSVAGSDDVQYQVQINGVNYYYAAGAWHVSDGTYSQSSTRTVINTNLSTLLSSFSITQPFYLKLRVFLHSATGASRPSLTSNTWVYAMLYGTPVVIQECLLYGYLSDLLGDAYTLDATKPVKLNVRADRGFFHGNRFIRPFVKTATADVNGYFSLSVIETTTPGIYLEFFLSYYEGKSLKSVKLYNARIPNVSTRALSDITSVRDGESG